jgi:hypothetical protein
MATIVIGGHSRSVGKTSVVAGLISALPEYHWTAFKITQYGHGICSSDGKPCDCACADHSWAISEERDKSGESDTSRFLVAGAVRAWWVRTEQGRLAEAMPTVRKKMADAENAIVESNSILEFVRPDLYVTVVDPSIRDFKPSAKKFLDVADAVVAHAVKTERAWADISLASNPNRPLFLVQAPEYVRPELVEFVCQRLQVKVLH